MQRPSTGQTWPRTDGSCSRRGTERPPWMPSTAGARWSLGEALAHVSRSERLQAGELFATGTLPAGSGIEAGRLLEAGDEIEIAIEGIGRIRNGICREGHERS